MQDIFMLRIKEGCVLISLLWLFCPPTAKAQSNVLVSFTTTNATPLNIGFAGFTTELLRSGFQASRTSKMS